MRKESKWSLIKEKHTRGKNGSWMGLYRCECGTVRPVVPCNVDSGRSRSCGCINAKRISDANRRYDHGYLDDKRKEYKIWTGIKGRTDPANNIKRYGNRGISISKDWHDSFEKFYSDMGPAPTKRHSVDRIDNDGNYEASNCRWATQKEQTRNTSKNVVISLYGVSLCVGEWAEVMEIPGGRIWNRLRYGYSEHDSIFAAKRGRGYSRNG